MPRIANDDARRVRNWISAVFVTFAMLGAGFGVWLGRLPAIRDHLAASTFEMSVYGLCLAAGSLTGLAFSGRTVTWLGARRSLAVHLPLLTFGMVAAILLFWAGHIVPAVIALFIYGFAFSTSDVSANVTAAEAERALGRPRMPLLHAAYSLGAVTSTGIGSLAEALQIPVPLHTVIAFALTLATALVALRWVPESEHITARLRAAEAPKPLSAITGPIPTIGPGLQPPAPQPERPYNPWTDLRIYLIGTIALSMSLGEGTGADWIALALVDGRGYSNSVATMLVVVFFVAMVATRVVGSALLLRFGRVLMIRASAVAYIVGVMLMILGPAMWASVLGAVLWGAGCALAFPVAVSAAADDPARAVKSVAAVSAIAYGAYLLGPMLIGFLGERFGLLPAFWPLVGFAVLCVVIADAVRRREPQASAAASAER